MTEKVPNTNCLTNTISLRQSAAKDISFHFKLPSLFQSVKRLNEKDVAKHSVRRHWKSLEIVGCTPDKIPFHSFCNTIVFAFTLFQKYSTPVQYLINLPCNRCYHQCTSNSILEAPSFFQMIVYSISCFQK